MTNTKNPRAIQAPNYTAKERVDLTREICKVYETGKHSLGNSIESAGVKDRTFRQWVEYGKRDIAAGKKVGRYSYAKCAELFKKAKETRAATFKADLKDKARTGLQRLIEGFSREETKVVLVNGDDGTPKVKEKAVTTKHTPPNVTAVIFALTNVDPENFKHKNDIEIAGQLEVNGKAQIKLSDGSVIDV